MKRLVDEHVSIMLVNLDSKVSKKTKEVEIVKEKLLFQKICLDSYKFYAEDELIKASSSYVASAFKDLSERVIKLEKLEMIRLANDGWEAEFTPGNIQEIKDSYESSLSRVVNESDGPAGVVRMGRVKVANVRFFAGRVGSGHDFVI